LANCEGAGYSSRGNLATALFRTRYGTERTDAKPLLTLSKTIYTRASEVMSSWLIRCAAAVLLAVHSSGVRPADFNLVDFSLNGFGTLGVVHSDYDQADFVASSLFHPSGVGTSHSWGAEQDSRLGLQVSAELGDRFIAVVQAVSQQGYDNTFTPAIEWANVKYSITSDLSIRAGRVVLPTFLNSETQSVGFVNPWVRTPAEVLVQLPLTNSDGVDVSYQFKIGAASHRLQVLYGNNSSKLPDRTTFKNTGIRTISDTIEYGAATVHLGYQRMHYSFGEAANADPPKYAFEAFDIGVLYDPGRWYLSAEQFNTRDEGVGNTRAWYLGGGYHLGKFTPYLVFSRITQTSVGTFEIAPAYNQHTKAAGLRWDFMTNLAAKLQYERIEIGAPLIVASFVNVQPSARIGDRANVLSATIDFVF
jgi:porin-like protein